MLRIRRQPLLALLLLAALVSLSPARAATPPPPLANTGLCFGLHEYPVVLVHGTFANRWINWSYMSPFLAAMGHCVYALDYGETQNSFGYILGLDYIENSAQQLAKFIDQVLAETGAEKVNIVGHSQGGGPLPRYYMKYLGGADKVNHLIGLGPSNHGTDLNGLLSLYRQFDAVHPLNEDINDALRSLTEGLVEPQCPSCVQQLKDSEFLQDLNAGGDTLPGPDYTVMATIYDEVVTPYTSQFLDGPQVTNITVQDECPLDPVEHLMMAHDPIVINLVINALDPTTSFFSPSTYCGGSFGGGDYGDYPDDYGDYDGDDFGGGDSGDDGSGDDSGWGWNGGGSGWGW